MSKSIYDERRDAFARGYREACLDILARLDDEGADSAREWIANNTTGATS